MSSLLNIVHLTFLTSQAFQRNLMNILRNILFWLIVLIFSNCSTGYNNEGNAVYYEYWNEGSGQHKDKINANPKTFKVLKFSNYAKDDKNVFYQGEQILGADALTFAALDDLYARDKHNGYYGRDTVKTSHGATFRVINSYYSTDEFDVFYTIEPLKTADPKNFKFIYGEGDYQSWTSDGKFYYYNNYKVPSDDYENMTVFDQSGGLSKDKNWVYFLDHKLNIDESGRKIIDTVDIATFKVTGYCECEDKYGCFNVFHGRKNCE